MKLTTLAISALCLWTLSVQVSCRKKNKGTECVSTLHAYTFDSDNGCVFGLLPVNYGFVDRTAGTISSRATFTGYLLNTVRGTYNSSDKCYYTLQPDSKHYASVLNKIDVYGNVTTFYSDAPITYKTYRSVVFNRVDNKLYCTTPGGSLGVITTSGSSYTVAPVVPLIHSITEIYENANIDIDQKTGDIYVQTANWSTSEFFIEKYRHGAVATKVIATMPSALIGMQFNENDNMLYAIQFNHETTAAFVKINPATGTVATLAKYDNAFSNSYFSATLDPCTNRYIYTTAIMVPGKWGSELRYMLYEMDLAGNYVKHDTTKTFYQGLEIAY